MSTMAVAGIAVLAFGVVVGIFVILARQVDGRDSTLERRLEFVSRDVVEQQTKKGAERTPSKFTKSLDEAVAGRSFAHNISTDLARANLKLTVGEYMMLIVVSVLGTGVITYLVMHQNPYITLGGLVVGFFLPRFYVKYRRGRRLKTFGDQLGDAINLLANGLRSGYSLLQAMDAVAQEMPPPISEEFRRVVREVGLGVSVERAMNNMVRRIPSEDLDLMITAVNVQHEVGGNLAEILETISHTIRERVRIKGEIRVLTAQQTISGYVLSFLPVGLGLILYAMNAEYMGAMFKDTCGLAMIGTGVLMMVIGFLAIRKIVDIEV